MIPKVSYNVYATNLNTAKNNNTQKIGFGNKLSILMGERMNNVLYRLAVRASVCKQDPNLLKKEAIEELVSILKENPNVSAGELAEQFSKVK